MKFESSRLQLYSGGESRYDACEVRDEGPIDAPVNGAEEPEPPKDWTRQKRKRTLRQCCCHCGDQLISHHCNMLRRETRLGRPRVAATIIHFLDYPSQRWQEPAGYALSVWPARDRQNRHTSSKHQQTRDTETQQQETAITSHEAREDLTKRGRAQRRPKTSTDHCCTGTHESLCADSSVENATNTRMSRRASNNCLLTGSPRSLLTPESTRLQRAPLSRLQNDSRRV